MLLFAALFMIIRAHFDLGIADHFVGVYEGLFVFLHWKKIGSYFFFLTQYA
jgi:hypothetical protein